MERAALQQATDREALGRAYLDAWNAGDPEAVAAFFADDAVYDDRGAGVVARGRDAIRDHVASVLAAFPDLSFELARLVGGEGFAMAEWRCTMTHRGTLDGLAPTGRVLTSAGVDVATLDAEDRLVHLASYYDGAELMRGLGVLPARGSRAERLLARAASLVGRLRR